MPGGKGMRRRAKLAEKANQGNLHKAAKRKAGASAHLPLPAAPTQEDYREKVPASLARLMALKAAASQPNKKAKMDTSQFQQARQSQQQQQQQQQKPAKQQQAEGQLAGAAAEDLGGQAEPAADEDAGARKAGGKAAAAADKPEAPKSAGLIWEQPKKLKQRRKDYLKAKKLKKKGKKGAAADQDNFIFDKPAFGEVVHQPPKVHLKSKHWDPATTAAAGAVSAGSQASQKSRAKHLHQPQQQQQQQQKRKQQQQGKAAKKSKQDPALQELREQIVEGYRAGRGPREGHATLETLKKLVQKQ